MVRFRAGATFRSPALNRRRRLLEGKRKRGGSAYSDLSVDGAVLTCDPALIRGNAILQF